MYFYIYSRPLWMVGLAIVLLVGLWAFGRSRSPKPWRAVNAVLLLLTFAGIVWVTVLRRDVGEAVAPVLRPFASFEAAKVQPEIYREMLMNVFMFVPLGLSFPYALPKKTKAWAVIVLCAAAAAAVSAGCEFMQYRLALGQAEVDDVLANVLGAVIGAMHVPLGEIIK